MEYIDSERISSFEYFGIPVPNDGGELQYLITQMVELMLQERAFDVDVSHLDLQEVLGALTSVQQRFFQEVIGRYDQHQAMMQEKHTMFEPSLYLK